MKNNRKTDNPPNVETQPAAPNIDPVAWLGLDWGRKSHAFALQTCTGQKEEGSLPHSAESLHGFLRELQARFGGQPVALAIEAKSGAVVSALLEYPWLVIYPINPLTSARYRQAFTPSGACDDLPDARVLLELVRDHAQKLRVLATPDEPTLKLAELVKLRRDLVDRRTQVLLQLHSLLESYYPQAFALVGRLDTQLALDFLSRWPDLFSLKATCRHKIVQFYNRHNLRRPELLQKRLDLIAKAVALSTNQARLSVQVLQLQVLVDQLRILRQHVSKLNREIKAAFAEHPEAELFRHLPGAGPAMAPRLCVAFGIDRTAYPNPESLQKLAGLAPVREKSGETVWTHWRWQAPVFLRQTWIEWAGQTVKYSAWARAFYEHRIAQGHGHWAVLRALAFKWIRVLWVCWQRGTAYDEQRYLQQLRRRKSPHAIAV